MATIFVTMVYSDAVFLDIWVRHYAQYTDRANLHIITHGPDEDYAYEIAKGCVFAECPRDPKNSRLDADRFAFINAYCADLAAKHERVIYNDVDEIVVLDPDAGDNLVTYLDAIPPEVEVITPLGLEIIHQKYLENDYDFDRGLFRQRRFVRANGHYTKPCITGTPITWGPDGHGCSHDTLYLDDNLYLFHLKWFDHMFHLKRYLDRAKMRFIDDHGRVANVGFGSWQWSDMTYQIATNSFLAHTYDKFDLGFDFTAQKTRCRTEFGPIGERSYKVPSYADRDLRELPARFADVI